MRTELIMRLQNQPSALNSLLFGLTEPEMLAKPIQDKWSIFENLAHLARYQEILKERVVLMTGGNSPIFSRYKADDDGGFFEWLKKSYPELMESFKNDREILNNYLPSLAPTQLHLTAGHPVYGTMNVEGWVEFFLLHEAHHFFTIFKLAAMLHPERVMGQC